MLLRVEEVAKKLQISRSAVYELCHRPDFPAIWIHNHCVRIVEAQLPAWLEQETRKRIRSNSGDS